MLKCSDCGNTDLFTVGAKEYHRYLVSGDDGNFITDMGSEDNDMSDDYCCQKCDSFNVERVKGSTTEHETSVKVNLSCYVSIATDSHPEDIDDDAMRQILIPHVQDLLKSIIQDYGSTDTAMDGWDYENVKMFVDGKEQE
jgi:hypothetical protein